MKHRLFSFLLFRLVLPVSAQLCEAGTQTAVLRVNKVRAPLNTDGAFFSDVGYNDDPTGDGKTEIRRFVKQ